MNLILISITSIELVLSVFALMGGIILIKRQDSLRHNYFLFKRRLRILREFKELFYSYTFYRESLLQENGSLMKDERISQLAKNKFFENKGDFFESLNDREKYLVFKEKLNKLDLLSDDFKLLYPDTQVEEIQSFIFWYRTLLSEIASYKRDILEGNSNFSNHQLMVELRIKNLEKSFQSLNEGFTIGLLENEAKLKD